MAANMNKRERLPAPVIVWLVLFCICLDFASSQISVVDQCPCDVTGNACDVNCCCDEDCSDTEIKLAFPPCSSFSQQQEDRQEGRVCFPKDLFLFENADSVRSETVGDSFCIYPDDSGNSSTYTEPTLVISLSNFQEYRDEFSSFSFQSPALSDALLNASSYKSGDPIYTVTDMEAVSVLGLPRPLTSMDCVDSNPAAYLTNETFSCVRSIADLFSQCENSPALDARNYFAGFRVVTRPELFQPFNSTVNETQGFGLYNSSFTTELKLDNRTSVDPIQCRNFTTGVVTPCSYTTLPSPTLQAGSCRDVLVQVDYAVVTEGSAGISEVFARFVLTSVPVPAVGTTVRMKQTFSAAFELGTSAGSFERSGNPGYIVGQPLLAGTLNRTGSTTDRIEVNADRRRYMTVVRSSASGECVTAVGDRSSVLFGRDVSTGCRLTVTANNLTEFCSLAQQSIISTLEFDSVPEATDSGYRDNNRYVGLYGSSNVTQTGDWVKIVYENRPLPTPPPAQTSSCRLSLGMRIQVMFANIGALVNPQPKIIAVVFTYDNPTDVQVTVPSTGQVTQPIWIATSVSFLDVSKEAVTYDPRPSIYDAKVPDDFFYPFITGSASHCGCVWAVLSGCLCALIILTDFW